jgi:branched-subunit amino acid aminotransferase/4-amino-4-deoxychorismate lyase
MTNQYLVKRMGDLSWRVAQGVAFFLAVSHCDLYLLVNNRVGAYTTMRTVSQHSIFEFDLHVHRMAASVSLILIDEDSKCPLDPVLKNRLLSLTNPSKMRQLMTGSLRLAVKGFTEHHKAAPSRVCEDHKSNAADPNLGELRLVVLLTWQCASATSLPTESSVSTSSGASCGSDATPTSFQFFIHVSALPPPPKYPVKAMVKIAHRENPLAKNSEWIRESEKLQADMPPDVNEIVMAERPRVVAATLAAAPTSPLVSATPSAHVFTFVNGSASSLVVLEGLSSNFFSVLDGVIYTAAAGVLLGSVRNVVISVCQQYGIPLKLEAPRIADRCRWQGAFITSTSRLVLPVNELLLPPELHCGGDSVLRFDCSDKDSLVARVQKLVLQSIHDSSERVLEPVPP